MKVKELFEKNWPGYDDFNKVNVGTQKDFLEMINATPQDIADAIEEIQKTHSFQEALKYFNFESTPVEKKHGTLKFHQRDIKAPYQSWVGTGMGEYYYYKIYANGQIRQGNNKKEAGITRLKSHPPILDVDNPKDVLVKTWEQAIDEIIRKYLKK